MLPRLSVEVLLLFTMRLQSQLALILLLLAVHTTLPVEAVAQETNRGEAKGQLQMLIGAKMFIGDGVPKDVLLAARYIRTAADLGNADAQNMLGTMYKSGEGVAKDNHKSAKWFRQAANTGHAEAQCNLGIMYASGHGVPQDYLESVRWFRLSANQGSTNAQHNLGVAFNQGRGVQKNQTAAYALFNIASANKTANDSAVIAGRTLASISLNPTQILEAQALTRRMSKSGKLISALDEYLKSPNAK